MGNKGHYNAADEKQVNDATKKHENQRDQELEDMKFILDSPQGIRFFTKMFEFGKMFTTTFTGDSQSDFLEGHRNFALKYFNDICEASPKHIAQLMIRKKE